MKKFILKHAKQTLRLESVAIALLALVLALSQQLPDGLTALAAPNSATYTVTMGSIGGWTHPDDTPSFPYIDKDGSFYFQSGHALYGATEGRTWSFFSGTNFDTASINSTITNAVNPNDANDKNNDTTHRCNDLSPTGVTATFAGGGSGYSQKNYCDLAGVWIDPDTGNWYGLVHNEFTPQPFGDGLHYDSIDVAVSTNQGLVWTITGHAITSPYSTTRNDTTGFPNQTYYYGDGDQRLFVDYVSGYFYAFYGSRVVDKSGGWTAFYEHVARAPISSKLATGSWQKWYNGAWTEPGVGGKESNMVPVDGTNLNGYTPTNKEYNPANTGTSSQQIAAGLMPPTSPLFVMDISYDAYLGLYIGEPQAVDQSGNAPQQYYVSDDLATQKWYLAGNSGSYHTASWYRWFLDGANKTSSQIIGKSFRAYCSFGCSGGSSSQYINITVDSSAPAAPVVDLSKTYNIRNSNGRVLAQVSASSATTSVAAATGSALEQWYFISNSDGSYRIYNFSTGQLLGVNSSANAGRAWGAQPTVTADNASVGQQWFFFGNRLVNRYSGLSLAMSSVSGRLAETTPYRNWTDAGNPVGGSRTANEQTLTFVQVGIAPPPPTAAPTPTPDPNRVQNPGFETGSLAPWGNWNNTVVASNAHTGTYSMQVGTATGSGEQSVSLTPNTAYVLKGWVKTSAASVTAQVGVKNYGGTETFQTSTSTAYTQLTVNFTTGPTNGSATIYCYKPTGTGNVYCDDFSVIAAPTGPTATPTRTPTRTNTPTGPSPTPTNTPSAYTQNFDSGIGGWTRVKGTGAVAVETGQLSIDALNSDTVVVDNNSPSYANATVTYNVIPQNANGRTLLVFRYTSTTSWGAVGYDLNGNWVWVNGAGAFGNLITGGTQLASGTTYTIKVTYSGSTVTIWLNGAQIYTGTVSQLPTGAGKIGFRDWNAAHVHYDNVTYTTP